MATKSLEGILESRTGRRGFLKGSALAATTLGAALAASTGFAFAQEPRPNAPDRKPDEPEQKPDDRQPGAEGGKTPPKEEDPYKVARLDEKGREYRLCPVCGSNMYRQERTWTCENCGYSYEE